MKVLMNFLLRKRKNWAPFVPSCIEPCRKNFWLTYPDSLFILLLTIPNRQIKPLSDYRSTMCIRRLQKRKYESYELSLFLLHYLYSQPNTVQSLHQNSLDHYLLNSLTSPCFLVLKKWKVSQAMCSLFITSLLECLKLKFLFVFEVHVYFHESLRHIGSS